MITIDSPPVGGRFAKGSRRGAVAVMVAVLSVPMLGMVAFGVDYGYILWVRAELQRAADAAALAAVQELVPASDGSQDLNAVRQTVRSYANSNISQGASDYGAIAVLDADIEIGRYDPSTVYSGLTLLSGGVLDTVRVTLRRDSTANSSVSLFFARLIGMNTTDVTASATAVLPKARNLRAGSAVLPFGIPQSVWNSKTENEIWSIYGDGKIRDADGDEVPGNWGTVDIGATSNSTAALVDQIKSGLRQSDLNHLHADGRISTNNYIDSVEPMMVNADTGISSGMRSAVESAHGETRLVPIYDTLAGKPAGNNLEFHIVAWGVVKVTGSHFQGAKDTYISVSKSYIYDGLLTTTDSLSDTSNVIENAYAAPMLVY